MKDRALGSSQGLIAGFALCLLSPIFFSLSGCSEAKEQKSQKKGSARNTIAEASENINHIIGINASDFQCSQILSQTDALHIFGGPIKQIQSPYTPPFGVPSPCMYIQKAPGLPPIPWTFDLDCRGSAQSDAKRMILSYQNSPEAQTVEIGANALDHHDSSLIFIDDNTPCYGRVTGPDSSLRRTLALHLVQTLTLHTAPMGVQFTAPQ